MTSGSTLALARILHLQSRLAVYFVLFNFCVFEIKNSQPNRVTYQTRTWTSPHSSVRITSAPSNIRTKHLVNIFSDVILS
jgi:hypothetical protein